MKRKLCALLLLVVSTVLAVCTMSACDNSVDALQMDKKYYDSYYLGSSDGDEEYYIFHSDGTGEYRRYSVDASPTFSYYNEDYTVKFKYTYVDADKEAVVCFYDSVTYGSKQGGDTYASKTWRELLTVSKNVLWTTGNSCYINEDYLKEIPNFGK